MTQTDSRPEREQAISAAVAARMRQLRDSRGWSAARLAEEMRGHGFGWTRMVVVNLENGRRSIKVAELISLAAVFDVSPMVLIEGGEVVIRLSITT